MTTAEKVREPESTLGVGDGSGQLFVHGSYEAIKAVQAIILNAEQLTAELASLQREREKAIKLAERWEKIADRVGVRSFTGNDHLLFANELRAVLGTARGAGNGRVE